MQLSTVLLAIGVGGVVALATSGLICDWCWGWRCRRRWGCRWRCARRARDVLCNEIPQVYRDHRPCALCALAGCAAYLRLEAWEVAPPWASVAGVGVTTGSRLAAVAGAWTLPSGRPPGAP